MTKRWRISISGRVQGVFYRKSTLEKASGLELTGWVKNEADGSVLCEAQGEPGILEVFHHWLKKGPPLSRVDKTVVEEIPVVQGEPGFSITH